MGARSSQRHLSMILLFLLLLMHFCLNYNVNSEITGDNVSTICRGNAHVVGRWVEEDIRQKTYYVCSHDEGDYKLNPRLCGPGKQMASPIMHGSKTRLTQSGGHAVHCDKYQRTRHEATRRERHVWKPLLCSLLHWDANRFCQLLHHRRLLMIGDSTMIQTAAALMSRITWDFRPQGAGCANQLAVLLKRRLQEGPQLLPYINNFAPNIIVVNTGAHFQNMSHFTEEFDALRQLQLALPANITWVWKTMNPGHVDCHQRSTGQHSDAILAEKWLYSPDIRDKYNWHLFPRMDDMANQLLPTEYFQFMRVLDMSPLYYRRDAHPPKANNVDDCLHYCLPGPVDLFGVLLLNMMHNGEI